MLEVASRAYELFISSEVEEKRQLLRMALQNLQLDGNNLVYTVIKPFDSIVLANDSQVWLAAWVSNQKRGTKGEF